MQVFYPPNAASPTESGVKVFLAGSIEMNKAEDWQERILERFEHTENIIFFNPRRKDWDSSWTQNKNDINFYSQVNWELDMLASCDLIAMYLDPATKSPISLLELGMFAAKGKPMIVCCPEGFWRKGNVDIVCERFKIPLSENFGDFLHELSLSFNLFLQDGTTKTS